MTHPVELKPDSLVAAASGTDEVNPFSSHHQAIRALGAGLEAVGWASDGIIEAMELAGHSELLAVQWHPERSTHEDADQQSLFDTLVKWSANGS